MDPNSSAEASFFELGLRGNGDLCCPTATNNLPRHKQLGANDVMPRHAAAPLDAVAHVTDDLDQLL